MKVKNLAYSFLFSLLFCTLIFILLHSEIFAKYIGSSETIHNRIDYFINNFISYRQTGENIVMLDIGGLTVKLDLELLRNIRDKIIDVLDLLRQSTPKFMLSFIRDFLSSLKDVAVSIYNSFYVLVQNI